MNPLSPRLYIILFCLIACTSYAQSPREKIRIDDGWRFFYGHPSDPKKDFDHATGYFSYLAKTGYGDGPADPLFDDRAWRKLDLPHDWAVEQGFSEAASFSHGFKASGKGFPEKSVGWYRKKITIPASDLGRIISLQFDGVFRHSKVWVNGHFLGMEESGYNSFNYEITAYLNYGGDNTIAVRVDASMEEGWFYEGAGIYRHVYLQKTDPLHIVTNGTYITTDQKDDQATINIQTTIQNKGDKKGTVTIAQTVFDPSGKQVAAVNSAETIPSFYHTAVSVSRLSVSNPSLWDLEHPNLYKVITELKQDGRLTDTYQTEFGIRSIQFEATQGFFLNGQPVKLQGTNNHQDHAGVGTAMPDELQYFRISKLKEMGANAYRCSHHPPTPELLEACDRLGMLVIDETRLMGINELHLESLQRMIERDRNHPSIICWSAGNEEWRIEGNNTGERVIYTMQQFVHGLDPTRPVTVGLSSGFRSGISSVVEIMGYNYMGNGDIDAHHRAFPQQPGIGTEEGSTFATRGIYFTDDRKHYQSAYDRKPRPSFYSIEEGWKFYAARPYLAGMFIWTGFDYRGEPTPYGWPSVTSYFGMMDLCGFPKDNVYYLRSWWRKEPVLHLLPHWNWQGMEGKPIDVWAYSNCDEVELFLNKKSLGKKKMQQYGHLEWKVVYQPGTLEAIGFKNGRKVMTMVNKTTGQPEQIRLTPHKQLLANKNDLAIVTVEMTDKTNSHIPTCNDEIQFTIKGGGRIIGVGNGDPVSLEKDKFIDEITLLPISNLEEQALTSPDLPSQLPSFPDKWTPAFKGRDYKNLAPAYAYRGGFVLNDQLKTDTVTLFYQKIGIKAVVFINGIRVTAVGEDEGKFALSADLLKRGVNSIHIIATPVHKVHDWDAVNENPGTIQIITSSGPWKRKLFNGYAQVIVQADGSGEEIVLSAKTVGVAESHLKIKSER